VAFGRAGRMMVVRKLLSNAGRTTPMNEQAPAFANTVHREFAGGPLLRCGDS
jgi:hypothetical protein